MKAPYIDQKLMAKVGKKMNPIKTWARNSQIPPEFVGTTFQVHNGHKFVDVFVNESMVGHRLGEFSLTRTFHSHGAIVKRTMEKT